MFLNSIFFALTASTIPAEALVQNKDFLVRQLQNSSSDLRINAAQKLGELRYPDTLSAIAELAKDPVPEVRFNAIQSLSKFSNQEALEVLATSFSSEADPYLKSEIRRAKKYIEDILKADAERTEKAAAKAASKAKSKETAPGR